MDIWSIILFLIVFTVVISYFSIEYWNFFKTLDLIKIFNDINNSDEIDNDLRNESIKNIDKFCKINILTFCITFLILSLLYTIIISPIPNFINLDASIILIIMIALYSLANKTSNLYGVKVYKIINILIFIMNIILMILPLGFMFLIFGYTR